MCREWATGVLTYSTAQKLSAAENIYEHEKFLNLVKIIYVAEIVCEASGAGKALSCHTPQNAHQIISNGPIMMFLVVCFTSATFSFASIYKILMFL